VHKKAGNKTVISVMISQPAPKSSYYKEESLEEKVDRRIQAVESNHIDSEDEWKWLKCLYEKLSRKKNLSEPQLNILDKLETSMEKYANHDSIDSVNLDAQYMWRGED